MWRFIILASVLPFILGFIGANLFGLSILKQKNKLSRTTEQLINQFLLILGREDIVVEFVKSPLWAHKLDGKLRIPAKHQHSNRASHTARALVSLGMLLLHEKQPAPISWRLKVIRLGNTLPVFILLITIFGFIVAKIPMLMALAIVSSSLSLCVVMLWLSLSIEKEAALLMVSRVEKLRILPRLREEEDLVEALRATPWVSMIPGTILRFMLRD